jgi:hypothetical protein
MTEQLVSILDTTTNTTTRIDASGKLLTAEQKRIIGTNNITDALVYTNTVVGTGTNTVSGGASVLATGVTANSSIDVKTTSNIRFQFGRINLWRAFIRFPDTGVANNTREFGLFIDATSSIGFRLSGTSFGVFYRKNSVTTVIPSGFFNGEGRTPNGIYNIDTVFRAFEIEYFAAKIIFCINGKAIHTLEIQNNTTGTFTAGLIGKGYFNNTNAGGSTTNVSLEVNGFGVFQYGTGINNPFFYCVDGVTEVRTLKASSGTLQTISITRTASAASSMTVYDNTTNSGTKIAIFDLNLGASIGTHTFGLDGVNFANGLTYETTGVTTNGSITFTWE